MSCECNNTLPNRLLHTQVDSHNITEDVQSPHKTQLATIGCYFDTSITTIWIKSQQTQIPCNTSQQRLHICTDLVNLQRLRGEINFNPTKMFIREEERYNLIRGAGGAHTHALRTSRSLSASSLHAFGLLSTVPTLALGGNHIGTHLQ